MIKYKVVFDEKIIPYPKTDWEEILESLDCGRSFVTNFKAKRIIFHHAKKLGMKIKSSQKGVETGYMRIWRVE